MGARGATGHGPHGRGCWDSQLREVLCPWASMSGGRRPPFGARGPAGSTRSSSSAFLRLTLSPTPWFWVFQPLSPQGQGDFSGGGQGGRLGRCPRSRQREQHLQRAVGPAEVRVSERPGRPGLTGHTQGMWGPGGRRGSGRRWPTPLGRPSSLPGLPRPPQSRQAGASVPGPAPLSLCDRESGQGQLSACSPLPPAPVQV